MVAVSDLVTLYNTLAERANDARTAAREAGRRRRTTPQCISSAVEEAEHNATARARAEAAELVAGLINAERARIVQRAAVAEAAADTYAGALSSHINTERYRAELPRR